MFANILQEANLWHRVAGRYKPLRVPKSDIGDALTVEESCKLLQVARVAAADAVAPYAAVISQQSAMRSKEIRHLQLGAIHLEDQQKPYIYVRRRTTKTNRGARYVALDTAACWALRKLIGRAHKLGAIQPEHFLLPTMLERHTRANDPLHGGTGHDPTHPMGSWDKEWEKVRKAASITHRRFHDLRHTYITRAAEAGVPLQVIQAQVGHLSVAMVEHYTHICQPAIHAAVEQIQRKNPELLRQLGLQPGAETEEALGGESTASRELATAGEAIGNANKHLFQNLMLDEKEGTKTIQ